MKDLSVKVTLTILNVIVLPRRRTGTLSFVSDIKRRQDEFYKFYYTKDDPNP